MEPKPVNTAMRWKASLGYAQGSESPLMVFSLICKDIPVGSKIAMTADVQGPVPPIFLEPTTVSTYPTFTTGLNAEVPAGYQSTISFELYTDGAPPEGSGITFQAAYPKPGGVEQSGSAPVRLIIVSQVTTTN